MSNNSTLFSSQLLSKNPSGFGHDTHAPSVDYPYSDLNLSNMSRLRAPQWQQQQTLNLPRPQLMQATPVTQEFDANTPVAAMTAGQMLSLIQSQTKPLENKVESIEHKLDMEIGGLKNRIGVLESEVREQKERNETLTQIVVEMQKSLNKIDSNDREKNLMISGLPEDEIQIDDVTLSNDNEKVIKMFNLIDIEGGPWNVERIGKQPTNGKTRIAKVMFPDKESRDKAAEQSMKLKDLGEPWK